MFSYGACSQCDALTTLEDGKCKACREIGPSPPNMRPSVQRDATSRSGVMFMCSIDDMTAHPCREGSYEFTFNDGDEAILPGHGRVKTLKIARTDDGVIRIDVW